MTLIILDKDQTLIKPVWDNPANSGFDMWTPSSPSVRSRSPRTLDEQVYYPGVLNRCEALRKAGHTLAICSNQGGVAFGYLTQNMATLLVSTVAYDIKAEGYTLCVVHPKGTIPRYTRDSQFRKPNPGMLLYLMDSIGFEPRDTLFVGDTVTDRQAAKAAGCMFELAHYYFGRPREA